MPISIFGSDRHLRDTFAYLDADDRAARIENGHRLKALGQIGYDIWVEHPKRSSLLDETDADHRWATFNPNRTSFRAIFADGQRNGCPVAPVLSKNILAAGPCEAGIDGVGLMALGTPPEGHEATRRGDRARLATIYAGQVEMREAMVHGARMREMVASWLTAPLHFERDPHGRHRSILIEAIMPQARVVDLFV